MTEPVEFVWAPPPEPPVSFSRAGLVAVVVLLLGAPAGLVWAAFAPTFPVSFTASGPSVDDFDDAVFFAVDGTFLVVAAIAGLLSGLVAWRLGRGQGPAVAVALAGGSLAAARVARTVGERVVLNEPLRRFCSRTAETGLCALYDGTPELRSTGLVLTWAVAALLTFSIRTLLDHR